MAPDRYYRWGQFTLRSAAPLPELPPARRAARPWTIRMSRAKTFHASHWFRHWDLPDGRRWLSFAQTGDDYLLRFSRTGAFRISMGRREIVCEVRCGVPAETRRHLLLNQVLPLVAGASHLVVHASGVRIGGQALGLVGEGGAGKSTLAAALCRRGAALVCDDALVIERAGGRWVAVPGDPSLRLWRESIAAVFRRAVTRARVAHYTSKCRVPAGNLLPLARRRAPLGALFLLARDERRTAHGRLVHLTRLRPRQALIALVGMAYQIDLRDRARLAALTGELADLVEAVPVYRLRLRAGLAQIDAAARQIAEIARGWRGEPYALLSRSCSATAASAAASTALAGILSAVSHTL